MVDINRLAVALGGRRGVPRRRCLRCVLWRQAAREAQRERERCEAAKRPPRHLRPRRRRPEPQGPVWVAAGEFALEGPEFGGATVIHGFALRALAAAAQLGEETHLGAGHVIGRLGALQVGARRVEEFNHRGATFGLPLRHDLFKARHHMRRDQPLQGWPIAGVERGDDHLVGLLGADQEFARLEAGVAGADGGDAVTAIPRCAPAAAVAAALRPARGSSPWAGQRPRAGGRRGGRARRRADRARRRPRRR